MGFSCFLCHETFSEKLPMLDSVGGGDGQIERPVSVTKCGHLFHTECLKRIFAAECVNVWAAKSCPVCKEVLHMGNDVFRVHACPFEVNAPQYVRMEELQNQNDKLQHENLDLKQRIDIMFRQNSELQCNSENLMREKEALVHCNDQFRRINSLNANEIERQKHEIEKFRNIIINLSEKFTGTGVNDNGPLAGNNLPRNGTFSDCQQFSTREYPYNGMPPFNNANGVFKHPPGLGYPSRHENGSESRTSRTSSQQSHTAIAIPISPPEPEPSLNLNCSTTRNNNTQQTISGFPFPDFSTTDYNNGFKENYDPLLLSSTELDTLHSAATPTFSKVVGKPATTSKSPSEKEVAQSELTGKRETANKIEDKVELENKALNRNNAVGNFLDELFGKKDESSESDNSGKWHETKSRRRSQSKCSTAKSDISSDKKLYGSFSCPTCKAKWGSSHSFMNTAQTCRYCKTEVHPHSQGPILSRKQLVDGFNQNEKPPRRK